MDRAAAARLPDSPTNICKTVAVVRGGRPRTARPFPAVDTLFLHRRLSADGGTPVQFRDLERSCRTAQAAPRTGSGPEAIRLSRRAAGCAEDPDLGRSVPAPITSLDAFHPRGPDRPCAHAGLRGITTGRSTRQAERAARRVGAIPEARRVLWGQPAHLVPDAPLSPRSASARLVTATQRQGHRPSQELPLEDPIEGPGASYPNIYINFGFRSASATWR